MEKPLSKNTPQRNVKIVAIGKHLPSKKVSAAEIDDKLNSTKGWSLRATGIKNRYFAENESTAEMGAKALKKALNQTNLALDDLDTIVAVSGTTQQPIPCTAALIANHLGICDGITTFDINATCLGFLVGLDLLTNQLNIKKDQTVALIASEISSIGLNWEQKESASLFGDGAAAVIISSKKSEASKILASHFETYPEGASLCQIQGGSTKLHAKFHSTNNQSDYLFDMQGTSLFKLVMKKTPDFLKKLLAQANLKLEDIDMVIPHQASLSGLTLLRKRLGIPEEKFFIHVQEIGNTIAASIPIALHDAQQQGRIKRGDKVLLIGSSAGVSIGAIILEY